MTTMLLA